MAHVSCSTGCSRVAQGRDEWAHSLRGLTPQFPEDEPWCLIVEDPNKPAFFQPPVPQSVELKSFVLTADALDLLITSKNHDLKQAVAYEAEAQDWIYSLVSLQTTEGFGGRSNYGIARMNGGSSSRPMLGLAPLSQDAYKVNTPRPGKWFVRDLTVLLGTRDEELKEYRHLGYAPTGGLGLTWLAPWNEGEQLALGDLDIWFVEVCRRVRLSMECGRIVGRRGNSKASRIAAGQLKGAVGDPWAPVERTENKNLTLSEADFDYTMLVKLLLSGDYKLPILARPSEFESLEQTQVIVAQALSRGNCKTYGFKSRILPVGGKISHALSLEPKREKLHELAVKQIAEIKKFDKSLRDALVLIASGGNIDREKIKKEHYGRTNEARSRFDRVADTMFFEHLWKRFEAQEVSLDALQLEERSFVQGLYLQARSILEAALPSIPCVRLFRPRAEARAHKRFYQSVRSEFPELFQKPVHEETNDAVA